MQPTTPTTTPTSGSDLMAGIQQKLLDQSGIISSTDSNLENRLNTAISGIQTSTSAGDQATTLNYNRQIAEAQDQANTDQVNGRAAGSGGLLNIGALRELTNTTDKNLADLDERKQELILQNDAQGAQQISSMQMQALQFQQQANQQVFSNLLGLGQFGIQQQNAANAQSAANDAHTQALVQLIQDNPQAGINMNDTLESAAGKIGINPNSPDIQLKKAQIAQAYAAAANNANTAPKTYKISGGDTLYNIAANKGILLSALESANPSVDVNNLRPGQVINLPTSSSTPPLTGPQLTQAINQQIATPQFQALSKNDRALYIQSQGGTPSDFGY